MPRIELLRRVLWACVAGGLLFYLALTLWLASSAIFFPYQLDYGEGIVLWFSRQLALGHSIYKGLEGLPYASSNYPPLGMALAAPFGLLFGDAYSGGRWLNLASALVTTAFIYKIVRGEGTRPAAALGALFFIGSTFVYHWVPLFRVDLIGLAFTAAGITFVWDWERKNDNVRYANPGPAHNPPGRLANWELGVAALLFLCALYTKHSLVFAPAAAFVAIFFRNRRASLAFALGFALVSGALFLAFDAMTSGGFAFGLFTSNATLWLWSTFLSVTNDFTWTYLVLIALALWGWVGRLRARRLGVLETYAVAALASLGLAGRVGAWENYYFEAVFVICIYSGIALAPLLRRSSALGAVNTAPVWLPMLLLIQLGLFWREHDPAVAQNLMDITRAGNLEVAPLVRAQEGTIISEDMGLLTTNGKPVDYYTFQYSSLARAGQWDEHWEIENLRAGNFPLVILSQGTREDVDHFRNFTREFVSSLDYGYAVSLEDPRYVVYKPAPLAHLQGADYDGRLALVGWSLAPRDSPRAGQSLTLTVLWKAQRDLNARYTAFAHVEDASGGGVAQDDHEPAVGLEPAMNPYPTTRWASGEMVRDEYRLRLPAGLKPGLYSLRVGWYDSVTQERLSVVGGADFVELTQLNITP